MTRTIKITKACINTLKICQNKKNALLVPLSIKRVKNAKKRSSLATFAKVGHTRPACTFYSDHLKGKQNKTTKAKPLNVTEASDQSEETSA